MKWIIIVLIAVLSATLVSAVCEFDQNKFERLNGLDISNIPGTNIFSNREVELSITDINFTENYVIENQIVAKTEPNKPSFLISTTSCVIADLQSGELSPYDAYHQKHVDIVGTGFASKTGLVVARTVSRVVNLFRRG